MAWTGQSHHYFSLYHFLQMLLLEKCRVHNHNPQIYVFKAAKYCQSEPAASFSWTLKALFQVLSHFLDTSVALNTIPTDIFTRRRFLCCDRSRILV